MSLIGPSGCGKSTLLRIVGDLIAPTGGVVEVNGKPAHQARLERDYGMVFQAPVLFDWRTVEGNVRLPLEVMGVRGRERDKRVRDMLELVELGGFMRHYPHQLSGGMQQRVAIARALALQPSLLLMDEPFGALDEMTRERLNAEVLRVWTQTGTTIIFVTHSIPEAVFLSSRVVVMSPRPGRVAEVVDIDLPQPRDEATRETDRYYELVTHVRESLRAGVRDGDPSGGTPARGRVDPRCPGRRARAQRWLVRVTAVAEATPSSARRLPSIGLVLSRLRHYLPALVVLIVVLVVWEVWTGGEGRRVIPPPSRIAAAFVDQRDLLFAAAAATYYEAIGGLIIGTVAGVLVAFAAARWTIARDVLLPVAIGASAIPLVAAAPIIDRLVRPAEPALDDDDGGAHQLLPDHDQRHPRPRAGAPLRHRAHALVRDDARPGPAQGARPEHAAVLLHGPEGQHDARVHRGHRRRVFRWRLEGHRQGRHDRHLQRQLRRSPGPASSSAPAARSSRTCSSRSRSDSSSRGTPRCAPARSSRSFDRAPRDGCRVAPRVRYRVASSHGDRSELRAERGGPWVVEMR